MDSIFEHSPKLRDFAWCKGDNLSWGEQYSLSIAHTLGGNFELILLDAPSERLTL